MSYIHLSIAIGLYTEHAQAVALASQAFMSRTADAPLPAAASPAYLHPLRAVTHPCQTSFPQSTMLFRHLAWSVYESSRGQQGPMASSGVHNRTRSRTRRTRSRGASLQLTPPPSPVDSLSVLIVRTGMSTRGLSGSLARTHRRRRSPAWHRPHPAAARPDAAGRVPPPSASQSTLPGVLRSREAAAERQVRRNGGGPGEAGPVPPGGAAR